MNRLKNIVPALVVVTLWAGLSLGCAAELPPQQDLQTAELALDQVPAPPAEEVLPPEMCVPISIGGPGNCKPYAFWAKRAGETCGDIGMKVAEIKPHERCSKTRFSGADVMCCNQAAQECVLEQLGSPKTCRSDAAWTAIAAKVCGEQDKSLTQLTSGVSCEGGKHRYARFECCGVAGPTCEPGTTWDSELTACCPDAIFVADCFCPMGWDYTSEDVTDDNGCLLGYGCGCTPHPCSDDMPIMCDMVPPQCDDGQVVAAKNGCYECVDPDTCGAPQAECVVSGCSGQICAPEMQISTCEWKPEYACLSLTTCGASADGICGWDMNDAYLACLEGATGGVCGDGSTWDDSLGACCPDAIYTADCWCEDGTTPQETTDYDDNGCLLGYGCECVPDPQGCYSDAECPEGSSCNAAELCLSPPGCNPGDICPAVCYGYCEEDEQSDECTAGTTWDAELTACCPDQIFTASCVPCPFGPGPNTVEVFDDNGCLMGYGCGECDPCGDGSEAVCMMVPPECEPGTVVSVQGGCFTCVDPDTCKPPVECVVSGCNSEICAPFEMMSTCQALPEYACLSLTTCGASADGLCGWDMNDAYLACLEDASGGQCGEGSSWDAELAACCPDNIYIADCWCEEGSMIQPTTDYDDNGCLLGYGCECVPASCTFNGESVAVGVSVPADDGCNSCECTPSGEMLCTQMPCAVMCEDETGQYAFGESWQAADGCNTCVCMADGVAACTKMACPVGCAYDDQWYSVDESFPATDGCNTCWCMEDGSVACTEMACVTQCTDETGTYAIGESWDVECNVCTCMEDGAIACTKMLCAGGCDYEGEWYTAGESFPSSDGCNSCWCTEDGAVACTLMACIETCETAGGESYFPGQEWDAGDDCNTCSCGDDGQISCTEMICK
ncbi:MAG: hypothetical protein ACPGU1_20750 [Myxococcota bacterium]